MARISIWRAFVKQKVRNNLSKGTTDTLFLLLRGAARDIPLGAVLWDYARVRPDGAKMACFGGPSLNTGWKSKHNGTSRRPSGSRSGG